MLRLTLSILPLAILALDCNTTATAADELHSSISAGNPKEIDPEMSKHVLHELSGPFIVSRTNVQKELKLSDVQKQKIQVKLTEYVQETLPIIEKLKTVNAKERETELQAHRQKSGEKLWRFLKEILDTEQFSRLQQLELQHEGPAALVSRPEIVKQLNITGEQRKQIIGTIQEMQKKIEPLIKEAHSRGSPKEILPKAIAIRKDYDGKIEAILSDTQKKQWRELRGDSFDVFNDN